MYAVENFRTKKALKEAVAASEGKGVPCYQPGPFGPHVKDGKAACEGPHYPEPHRWYAEVEVKDGRIIKVK